MQVRLKYFRKVPNAGDQFSVVLAQRYFGANVVPCDQEPVGLPNLLLLGSILEWADARSHVCGAGFISGDGKLRDRPSAINCVRGPLTAQRLVEQGIHAPSLLADPGILAPELFPQSGCGLGDVAIFPHYRDLTVPWVQCWREQGYRVVDPRTGLDSYFAELCSAAVILSSSLHGLIFAHAFNKPALWIELSENVFGSGFKFFDYYASVRIHPREVVCIRELGGASPTDLAGLARTVEQGECRNALRSALSITREQLTAAT